MSNKAREEAKLVDAVFEDGTWIARVSHRQVREYLVGIASTREEAIRNAFARVTMRARGAQQGC